MKNSSKILSVILLAALIVSVFAIFTAFAEEVSELKPVTVLDLDSKSQTSIKMENSAQVERDGETVTSPSITKKTDENGEVYWLIETNVKAGETIGDGSGSFMTTLYAGGNVVVKSGSTGSSGAYATKNTDFMVIDFDVATDDVFIDSLNFHMRYGNETGATSQDSNGYPTVKGSSYSELYVLSAKDKVNKYNHYSSEMLVDEWVDVTFVYDFRGETQSAWKCYAYINGYFAGTLSTTAADSHYLQWLRLSVPDAATYDYESTKLRNLTYTKYPVGWSGDLTAGKIGVHAITLEHIDDLAYCVEDKSAPRFDGKTAIATIERAGVDEPINVYDVYDLDANFVDGDKVTLLRNIDMPIFVNANNVEFVTNGYRLNKVDTSSITGGAADFDWSTVGFVGLDTRTRTYVKHGTAAEFTANAIPSSKPTVYIMLSDMVYDSATSYKINGMYTVFDLNGYTLDLHANDRIYGTAATQGSNGIIRWQNGTLLYQGKRDITNTAAQFALIFQNLDSFNIAPRSGVLIDHRCGLAVFKDIDSLTTTSSVVNIASNTSACGVVYDGVTISTTTTITDMNNRAKDGANQYVTIRNSNITVNGANIITGYTRNSCTDANLNIIVDGSTLTTDNNFFRYQATTAAIDTTNIENNIKITNSTINADRVVYVDNSTNAATYLYNADVKVDGASKLNLENAFIARKNEHAGISADLAVADGVKIDGNVANVPAWVDLTLGDGTSVIAGTLDAEYGFVVAKASDVREVVYKNLAGETVKDYWLASIEGEVEDLVKLPTPAGKYDKYEWQEIDGVKSIALLPNFKVSANLTLHKDISLNIFLSFLEGEGLVDTEAIQFTVDGAENWVVTENKGVTKVQIQGITPEDIDKIFTIKATVSANGATVTKEVPVSIEIYCDKVLADETEGSAMANLMNAIKDYGKAADAYNAGTLTGDREVNYGEAKAPAASAVFTDVNLNLNAGFIWKVAVAEGVETVNAKYSYNGEAVEAELKVVGGKVTVEQKAFDLGKDITLTVGEETITFNFAFYAEAAIAAAGADAAKVEGMLDATWKYAVAAAAIKA